MVPFLAECWNVKLHSSTIITFSSVFYFVCLLFSFVHFCYPTEKFSWSLSQGSETSSCYSCATQLTKSDTYHVSVYVFAFSILLHIVSFCVIDATYLQAPEVEEWWGGWRRGEGSCRCRPSPASPVPHQASTGTRCAQNHTTKCKLGHSLGSMSSCT